MDDYVVASIIEAEERNHRERMRLRHLRDASNPFDLAEPKFRKLFRVPKSSAQYLVEQLKRYIQRNESGYIPIHLTVLAALHFFADGSYQAPVGEDSLISLSQPSISRAIEVVTNAIVDVLAPQYIRFPTTSEEKRKTMAEFQGLYNIPNVLGAVDGTHVAIFKPPNNHPTAPGVLFFNRKGFYSINCQVVTNAKGRILSINPNFPGSTHDSAVWRASELARHLEREFLRGEVDQWLLGDKGYQLLPWLMIPLAAPESEPERNYNLSHARARNVVEMSFGRLKNKLRCLHKHRTLHYEPTKAAKIIIACCTIYNMFCDALSDSDDEPSTSNNEDNGDDFEDDTEDALLENDYLTMARAKRELLIQHFR